jgi:hypothetical protein
MAEYRGQNIRTPGRQSPWKITGWQLISHFDFRLLRDVDEICVLLGYYAASCDNCLPTFRDNVSVPSSRVKSPSRKKLVALELDFGVLTISHSWHRMNDIAYPKKNPNITDRWHVVKINPSLNSFLLQLSDSWSVCIGHSRAKINTTHPAEVTVTACRQKMMIFICMATCPLYLKKKYEF